MLIGGDEGNDGTGNDMLLMELSPMGQILRKESFGSTIGDFMSDVIDYNDGVLTAVGSVKDIHGAGDFAIFQYDFNQDSLLWTHVIGGSTYEDFRDCAVATNGDFYAMTSTYSFPTNNSNPLIIKIDNSGTILWKKKINGSSLDRAHGITATADGGHGAADLLHQHVIVRVLCIL